MDANDNDYEFLRKQKAHEFTVDELNKFDEYLIQKFKEIRTAPPIRKICCIKIKFEAKKVSYYYFDIHPDQFPMFPDLNDSKDEDYDYDDNAGLYHPKLKLIAEETKKQFIDRDGLDKYCKFFKQLK